MVKDLPLWAQKAIAKEYGARSRPLCEVVAAEELSLGPGSYGSNHFFVCDRTGEVTELLAVTPHTEDKRKRDAYFGRLGKLGKGRAVLHLEFYPSNTATFYINPKDWGRIAPKLPKTPKLNHLDVKALCIIEGLIPSARLEPFGAWGIDEEIFVRLRKRGLIARNGAITIKGRNSIRCIDIRKKQNYCSPPFELQRKYEENA